MLYGIDQAKVSRSGMIRQIRRLHQAVFNIVFDSTFFRIKTRVPALPVLFAAVVVIVRFQQIMDKRHPPILSILEDPGRQR